VRVRLALMCLILAAATIVPAGAARSVTFSVPPADQVLDLHGDPGDAQLVIFAAGNQFMVMPSLIHAFQERHPEIARIYYETLPPGIVLDQIRGGDLRVGNLLISAKPDVVLAGTRGMHELQGTGYVDTWVPYASNELAIMVRKGNPLRVHSLVDLGRSDVRVAMPNPKWEGVAEQVETAYAKAGGAALVREIVVTKVEEGTTLFTRIHHRQTPMYLLQSRADAGPVWLSEALYAQRIGEPLTLVRIPASDNVTASYDAAVLRDAPHLAAAQAFVDFIKTSEARAIYASFGFGPPHA
jgi:molybdate transport system substrate-binding protein